MARSRILKPGFFLNERLAEMPFEGRLLFAGLWTLADREGRLEDRPLRIKAALFPFDSVAIDDLLAGLCQRGFITRYEAEEVAVIQITKFSEHQTPHSRELKSTLPASNDLGSDKARPRLPVSVLVSSSVSVSKDSGRGSADADLDPTVMVFPCTGHKSTWNLANSVLCDWISSYRALDVHGECEKALAWLKANPNRKKTAGGMQRFLVNWLNRAADKPTQAKPHLRLEPSAYEPFRCPHTPECHGRNACAIKTSLDAARAGAA